MTKRWTAYFLILAAATAAAVGAVITGMYIAAAAAAFFAVWWTIYYSGLNYYREGDLLIVKSGVFFYRTRRMRTAEILWTKRAVLRVFGENTLYNSLHTAGGVVVIFGEFSTEGLPHF